MSKITRFYYRLLSILSEKLANFSITIAIGKIWTFGHPWMLGGKMNERLVGTKALLTLHSMCKCIHPSCIIAIPQSPAHPSLTNYPRLL